MNTKLKCLILDDELPGLTYLKMLCQQIAGLEVVKAFNNPQAFLEEFTKLEFDFCIIDIEMPSMNGLQVANLLNGKPVIFSTAYKEYAVEAFELNAIDYMVKPIRKERLQQAVDKVSHFLNTKKESKKFIQINTDKGKSILFFEQLVYIKTSDIDSRDKIAQLSDGSTVTIKNKSFNTLLNQLPKNNFVRINKKELISLKTVQFFSFDEITTNIPTQNGNLKLILSDSYRKDFIENLKV